MILDSQKSEVYTKDVTSNKVGIDASNVNFITQLLTSNLYSNPLESFLRETIANGIDSNKEAGSSIPVLLYIEQGEEYNINHYYNKVGISIRDYGTGLSPERFDQIYRFIGSSTKRESNDFIGALGIGRFSCLSLSDKVYITSYYNKMKYEYFMYKDNGSINIDLFNEEPTKDPNGVMVTLECNVNMGDLKNALYSLQLLPIHIESNINDFNDVIQSINNGEGYIEHTNFYSFKYRLKDYCNYVEMGGIIYKVPSSFPISVISSHIILRCPIGHLQLIPSREGLIENDHNKEVIEKIYNSTIEEIKSIALQELKVTLSEYLELIENPLIKIDKYASLYSPFKTINAYDRPINLNGTLIPLEVSKLLYNTKQWSRKELYYSYFRSIRLRNVFQKDIHFLYKEDKRLFKSTIQYYKKLYSERIVILDNNNIQEFKKFYNCSIETLQYIFVNIGNIKKIHNKDVPKEFKIQENEEKEKKEKYINIIEHSSIERGSKQSYLTLQGLKRSINKLTIVTPYIYDVSFIVPLVNFNISIMQIPKEYYNTVKNWNCVIDVENLFKKRNRKIAKIVEYYIVKSIPWNISYYSNSDLYKSFCNDYGNFSYYHPSGIVEQLVDTYKSNKWVNYDNISKYGISDTERKLLDSYYDFKENTRKTEEILKRYFIKKYGLNRLFSINHQI